MRNRLAALAWIACFCAAACTATDPQPTQLGMSCSFDSDCDSGWVCVGGVCATAAGAPAPDAGMTPFDGGRRATSATDSSAAADVAAPVDAGQANPDKDTGSAGCTDASQCDDGLPCTVDACVAGGCEHKPDGKQCLIAGGCQLPGPFVDGPCLSCDPVASPTKWQVSVGASCDDGDTCTSDDACNPSGLCAGKATIGCCKADSDCSSTFACTTSACDKANHTCTFTKTPGCCSKDADCTGQAAACSATWCNVAIASCDVKAAADGAACNDGDGCTIKDSCLTGMCVGQANTCDDGNSCTSDACVAGQCSHSPIASCCSSGACCNVQTGQLHTSSKICGGTVASEQSCQGSAVMQRQGKQTCTGSSASCVQSPSHVSWGNWSKLKTCPAGTTCQLNGKFATCKQGGGSCNSGTCCNTFTKTYKPLKTKCSSSIKSTQYKCSGSVVQRRRAYSGCTGKSTICSSSSLYWAWSTWSTYQTCSKGYTCKQVGLKASCVKGGSQCSYGTCCNTFSKTYKPKGTKCSSSIKKVAYKCYGNVVQRRYAYRGCSGSSTGCSSSSLYYAWGAWATYKTCSAGYTCKMVGSTSATCSKVGGIKCISGTCCNKATKQYQPKGKKCGTSPLKTQYMCLGSSIRRRQAYSGCSGKATYCSSSSLYQVWTSWSTWKICAPGKKCKLIGSSYATCS